MLHDTINGTAALPAPCAKLTAEQQAKRDGFNKASAGHSGGKSSKAKKRSAMGTHERHWRMHRSWADLPAWRALEPSARVVYGEIELRFNGTNNSRIAAPVRALADATGIGRNVVLRGLWHLQAHGFIKLARQGSFGTTGGHAQLVTLTRLPPKFDNGKAVGAPTKDYESWRPGHDFDVAKTPRQQRARRSKIISPDPPA